MDHNVNVLLLETLTKVSESWRRPLEHWVNHEQYVGNVLAVCKALSNDAHHVLGYLDTF